MGNNRCLYHRASSSLPVRGAWVEMAKIRLSGTSTQSLPVRGAWVEISGFLPLYNLFISSLPVRGAWVEILLLE